jgi:hypothetical protein
MPSALAKKLGSLPTRSATFVEPMECLAVAKLPDGAQWLYEILCGARDTALARDARERSPTPHNSYQRLRKDFEEAARLSDGEVRQEKVLLDFSERAP